jgi:hypothetical protein
VSVDEKRWIKKANEVQFGELDNIRSTASSWRTGLLALTALLTAVTVIKGPEKASELSSSGRALVAILLGLALLALLGGSACSMLAAFGLPGDRRLITSVTIKEYVRVESQRALDFLAISIVLFFGGVLLIAMAIGFAWFDKDLWPPDPPAVVVVEVASDDPPICGELKSSTETALTIGQETATGTKEQTIQYVDLTGLAVKTECDSD